MKKGILFILLLSFCFSIKSQKRDERKDEKPVYETVFESEPIIGDSVMFWSYNNKLKKWGNREGSQYIPDDENQNFSILKTLLVKGNNENYYIIVFNNINVHTLSLYGMYKLDSASEYATTNSYYYLVFTQNDYNNIRYHFNEKKNTPLKIASKLCSRTIYQESYRDISKQVASLLHENGFKHKKSFWIEFETIDDKEVVRFRLPEDSPCGKGYFEKNYFEISMDEFKKLIPNVK